MDAPKNNQNGQQGKTQLNWSQPITTPPTTQPPAAGATTPKHTPVPPTNQSAPQATSSVFRYSVIAVVVLAIVGVIWAVAVSNKHGTIADQAAVANDAQSGTTTSDTHTSQTQAEEIGFAVASPQAAGPQVAITNVVVSVPTWVIVYENRDGRPGNALGAALFWQGKTSGSVELLRNTVAGQSYLVGEARDDGDRIFSLRKDPLVLDANGIPLWVQFEAQ